jgi:hypothetical protein
MIDHVAAGPPGRGRPVPSSNPPDDESTSSTSGTGRRTRRTSKAKDATEQKPAAAGKKPAARARSGEPRKPRTAKKPAETPPAVAVIRADPLHFGEDAYTFTDPEDQKRSSKSVYIPRGTVERARAAVAFCKALEYNQPELEGKIPTSLAALFDNAINRVVDQIEAEFNDGQPLRRVYKLRVGPSRSGAARGAAARAQQRAQPESE